MKTKLLPFFVFVSFLCSLCACDLIGTKSKKLTDYGNVSETSNNSVVNIIEQAKPTIMVIPSDNLLKRYNALQVDNSNGKTIILRDYTKYFLDNANNKTAISCLQDEFVQMGYPLTDLEQSLKSLENNAAMNLADNVEQDAKTLLLQAVSPDIIIELDYAYKMDTYGHEFQKDLSYTLTALDSYTNKAFSSHSSEGITGENFATIYSSAIRKTMKTMSHEINEYFRDLVVNGREITVRFTIERGSNIKLTSETIYGDTFADWIMDYMDTHAKKGTYKLQNNTDYELSFTNVRISALRADGTQNSGYHWARECIKAMRTDCGVKCTNKVQGLGNIHITIKGL